MSLYNKKPKIYLPTSSLFEDKSVTSSIPDYFKNTKAYEETSTEEKTVVNSHSNDLPYKFAVNVKERQDKLSVMYTIPKLHKRPCKARFIANSSSYTTTELSKLLTSRLTAVKSRAIRYLFKPPPSVIHY